MLFDLRPKEKREDLFDREDTLSELSGAVERGDPLILLLGLRRYGKTSVLKVFLNEQGYPYIYVDCRDFFLLEYPRPEDLAKIIGKSINQLAGKWEGLRSKIKSFLESIEEVSTPLINLKFREKISILGSSLLNVIDSLDEWASARGLKVILAFDEAQHLARIQSIDFRELLARVYDNNRSTITILTGSEVGLLYEFLKIDDSGSPLYGRYVKEIRLKPFTHKQAVGFLQRGFRELGVPVSSSIIEEVVSRVDGVVGWLTYYGRLLTDYYSQGVKVGLKELDEVQDKATKLALSEVRKVLRYRRSKRYMVILKTIALLGRARWSQIKKAVELEEGHRISDPTIANLLKNLVELSLVSKDVENNYYIPDPILMKALQKVSWKKI